MSKQLKMPRINNWQVCGNLARDAETTHFPNGTQKTEFTLAVPKGFGEKEKTIWVRCQAWGKASEKYGGLKKGEPVIVDGEYDRQDFTDKKGVKREASRLVVNSPYDIQTIAWPPDKEDKAGEPKPEDIEDDIPF